MEINSVSSYGSGSINESIQDSFKKQVRENPQKKKEDEYSNTAISNQGYDRNGVSVETNRSSQSNLNTAQLRQSIRKEVWDQAYTLLQQYAGENQSTDLLASGLEDLVESTGNSEDPLELGAYFAENPQDWEKVQSGEIPDYFNIENTAQRILDLWMPLYNESDNVETWVSDVKDLIGQAYDEVSGMVGGLPQLVQDTREYIMNTLDEFAQNQESSVLE